MIKTYIYTIIDNLFKLWSYFSIALLLINLFSLFFGSPILLDSIDNISNISNENLLEQNDKSISNENLLEQNDKNINTPVIFLEKKNILNKTKRWFYWRLFVNRSDRYKSYDEFKVAWASGFSLKKTVKVEFSKFKTSPSDYIKEEKNFTKNRINTDKKN